MIMELRFLLWKIGWGPHVCYVHKVKLRRHGFAGNNERWTCFALWGKTCPWGVKDATK